MDNTYLSPADYDNIYTAEIMLFWVQLTRIFIILYVKVYY